MKKTRINKNVKQDMRGREPDWWRPEDKEYWKLWKESLKQRQEIERRIDKRVNLIADVGSGQGRLLSLVPKTDAMVFLDISEKMVREASCNVKRKGIDNSYFIVGDAENIPLKESVADIAICLQTLIHVPNREKCLGELSRIMKEDGTLVVDIPIHNLIDYTYWSLRHGGVKNFLVDVMRKVGILKSYSSPVTRKEFYGVCEESELSIADEFKIGPWNTFILKKKDKDYAVL
ncbi:2-methoxy-6-polyprenyl-1,4-benzoquinol methylase [subsurface metagenome]